jgi:hypothetical protein
MPRRNNRDRQFEPKEYSNNDPCNKFSSIPSEKQKLVRRRKGKWDKSIYKDSE